MQMERRDVLGDLGYLFLGSRLKRLAERLQADAAKIIAAAGLPIQPAQTPLLAALDRYGALTVSEAVVVLGLSQPAVTRTLTSLVELGLIEATRESTDQRQKTLTLTKTGRAVMTKARREAWPTIESAATRLCHDLSGDLLEQIAAVEARLDHRSLLQRVKGPAPVKILEYRDDLAKEFHDINAEWITKLFKMEASDREILENPRARVIDRGGAILFASSADHGVVGTCALYKSGPGAFELTKMGVRESARGLKVGEKLLHAAILRARKLGAKKLYLLTNARCRAAIHLYEKAGFVHDAEIMTAYAPRYERCDVAMSYPLRAAKRRSPAFAE
jgi:DNA-binding MarR family transcriptional regulator